jgi:hypothetical protein
MKTPKRHIRRGAAPPLEELPIEERIRLRAYKLHQTRGGAPGRELDDWLQAERELEAEMDRPTPDDGAGLEGPASPQD